MHDEPLFTSEEMTALRADLQQPKTRTVESIDLVSGDHSFRKNIPLLERRLKIFAASAQAMLTRSLRQAHDCKILPTEIMAASMATVTMRDHMLVGALKSITEELYGFIGIEPALCFMLIERAFGAPVAEFSEDESLFLPNRDRLTEVEKETLSPLLQEFGMQLGALLFENEGGDLTVQLVPGGLSPEIDSNIDTAMVWRLACNLAPEQNSSIVITLLPNLIERVVRGSDPLEVEAQGAWMPGHLLATDVEVSSQLGAVEMLASELLAIRPGDVLRLDRGQADTVPVLIEGIEKLQGTPVRRNGAYGIRIEQVVDGVCEGEQRT